MYEEFIDNEGLKDNPEFVDELQVENNVNACPNPNPNPDWFTSNTWDNIHDPSPSLEIGTWIQGQSFVITKADVSKALDVPRVCRPTYPYLDRLEHPPISDVMTLLCGRLVTWGSNPRINSSELTELNYIFFRIACHNIFSISHVHTIPIERCFFLYALVTDTSICFPSLFIQTLAEAHRSKCKKHDLFFPVFIYRSLLANVHAEESLVDPTTAIVDDGDDEVHVDSADAEPTIPPPLSLRAMMETFMTTQVAHGQLLDGLIVEVAALRAEFLEYRGAFPPPPPSNS
nr:hypothetical protein CFP56_23574 [Quercus suber]